MEAVQCVVGLPSLTAEVINNHDMMHRERELMNYAMSMQGLATMGQIESGFSLLERAEAKGLPSRSDNEGFETRMFASSEGSKSACLPQVRVRNQHVCHK